MTLLPHRTAIYARVSSEQQAQHGTIHSQLAAVQEFAAAQGIKIDPDLIFADNGVSGTTLARPKPDALRDKAAGGEVDRILVLNPDRLARKYAHQLMLVEEFKKLGVEITFVNRQIAASPEDQLLLQIQGVISEYEREKIVERHRRGKLHKAQQGKVCVLSGAPYGYVYLPATDQEEARYQIHDQEAAVVRRIFQMLVEQSLSLSAIARKLTEENIPTRRDIGRWERSVIWAMLRNPAYMGQAAYLKTRVVDRVRPTRQAYDRSFYPKQVHSSTRDRPPEEWITIAVPAIISAESFEQARQRLEENKRFSPRNNKRYEYLLSGLLRCQQCGYALYGKPASNSKYKRLYYRCAGQDGYRWKDGRVCQAHPVRVEAVDELVWEQTCRLLEQPDLVLREYARRTQKKQRQQLEFKDLLAKKRREIKQQELEKTRLLDLYQTGHVELAEIEPRLKGLRSKIKKLHDECTLVEKEEKEEHHRLQLIEQFAEFTKRMNKNLSNLNFAERKQIVRLLVEEVLVNTSTDEITMRHILPLDQKFPLCKRSHLTGAGEPDAGWPGAGVEREVRRDRHNGEAEAGASDSICGRLHHHEQNERTAGRRGQTVGGEVSGRARLETLRHQNADHAY
jgi:site-specific DNA recombinase